MALRRHTLLAHAFSFAASRQKNGCTLLVSPAAGCLLAMLIASHRVQARLTSFNATSISQPFTPATHILLSGALTESASSIAVRPRAQGCCDYESRSDVISRANRTS